MTNMHVSMENTKASNGSDTNTKIGHNGKDSISRVQLAIILSTWTPKRSMWCQYSIKQPIRNQEITETTNNKLKKEQTDRQGGYESHNRYKRLRKYTQGLDLQRGLESTMGLRIGSHQGV